jgi:hypothetical protein
MMRKINVSRFPCPAVKENNGCPVITEAVKEISKDGNLPAKNILFL